MKRKITILFITIFLVIGLTSCQKQPSASFITDKTTYLGGDMVTLTNNSSDASSYRWSLPDGTTSNSKDASYQIPTSQLTGNLTFNLEALSKNGKKASNTSKTVTVNAINSNFIGDWYLSENWSSNCGSATEHYTITIDAGSSGDQVLISNFANMFYGEVSGDATSNSITIPYQNAIVDKNGALEDIDNGSFTLYGGSLSFNYQYDDILYNNTCGYTNASGTGIKTGKKMVSISNKGKH